MFFKDVLRISYSMLLLKLRGGYSSRTMTGEALKNRRHFIRRMYMYVPF